MRLLRAARRCDTARATGASTAAMRARSSAAASSALFAVYSLRVMAGFAFECLGLINPSAGNIVSRVEFYSGTHSIMFRCEDSY